METKKQKIGSLMAEARTSRGFSQQKVAEMIGKGRRTVQNWENGETTPNVDELLDYFRVIGANPTKQLKAFIFSNKEAHDVHNKLEDLHNVIDTSLTDHEIDILHYLLCCEHGHSVYAYLQKVIADLQCNMGQCQSTAIMIHNNYTIASELGVTDPEGPQPDMDAFSTAIEYGKQAYISNRNEYTIF